MSEKKCRTTPEVISVSMDKEWVFGKPPQVVKTTALGPCVGIFIYDPSSKQVIAGHLHDPRGCGLSAKLDKAVLMFPNLKNLQVSIGGQAPEIDDDGCIADDDQAIRQFVINEFINHGFDLSQLRIKYQGSNENTVMKINTLTGEVFSDTRNNHRNW